jgi:hypothetical protein
MSWFRPRDLLDQTFEVGIILKGLDGVLEGIGGLLLLIVSMSATTAPLPSPPSLARANAPWCIALLGRMSGRA